MLKDGVNHKILLDLFLSPFPLTRTSLFIVIFVYNRGFISTIFKSLLVYTFFLVENVDNKKIIRQSSHYSNEKPV